MILGKFKLQSNKKMFLFMLLLVNTAFTLDTSNWMKNLPDSIAEKPLSAIAIPGTHDTYTYDMSMEIADLDDQLKELLELLPGDIVMNATWNYKVTQRMNTTEQLDIGIRYFDVRTAGKDNITDEWYIYHGFYGIEIKKVMRETREFLDLHRKEVIILDFQHFFKISTDEHKKVKRFLFDTFSDIMVPRPENHLEELTLANIWARKKQVIVLYNTTETDDHPLLWPRDEWIHNPWANTPHVPTLIDFLDVRYGIDRQHNMFGVTQGVLTPNIETIVTQPLRSLEDVLAYKCNQAVSSWMKDKKAGLKGINVVITDYSEFSDINSVILDLNYRGFVMS